VSKEYPARVSALVQKRKLIGEYAYNTAMQIEQLVDKIREDSELTEICLNEIEEKTIGLRVFLQEFP